MFSLLIRRLAHIQTNMHHPAAADKALLYSIKYITVPGPLTRVQLAECRLHSAMEFLTGQFISLPLVAAHVLGNKLCQTTRNVMLASPAWNSLRGNAPWKTYLHRCAFQAHASNKQFTAPWPVLQDALEMATSGRSARYFSLHGVESSARRYNESSDEEGNVDDQSSASLATTKLRSHDGYADSPLHRHFDSVFSCLLPGEFLSVQTSTASRSFVRLRNQSLQFSRFIAPPPTMRVDLNNVIARSKHFEVRLFPSLNWSRLPGSNRLASKTPHSARPDASRFLGLLDFCHTDTVCFGRTAGW